MTTYFQFADIVGAAILLVMGDDSDSSTDEFGQRKDRLPSAPRPPLSGGSQPLAAPQRVTNVASLAKQLSPIEWSVPFGHLEAFLYSNAPRKISEYNFNMVRSRIKQELALRMTDGGRRSYDNVFKLTPEGAAQLAYNPDAICISIDLACSGEAVFNTRNPNCLRLCCSGIGGCRDECKGGGRFDGCGFRIELTTTLAGVQDAKSGACARAAPMSDLECCCARHLSMGSSRRRASSTKQPRSACKERRPR